MKMKKSIYSRRREIITMAFCGVLLLSAPLYTTIAASDLGGFWGRLIFLLTNISIYTLGASVLRRRHLLWVAIPMLPIYLYDAIYTMMYGRTADLMWTYTAVCAEGGETTELLTTYLPLCIVVGTLWGMYILMTYRYSMKRYFASKKVRLIMGSVSAGWLSFALMMNVIAHFTGFGMPFRTAASVSPINDLDNLRRIIQIRVTLQHSRAHFVDYQFGATCASEDDELVVLVLGETGRYGNWQINGYERATSPRMMARAEQLVTYDSCYSVANLTTESVPLILSRATPDSLKIFYEEPSLLQAFHEAGYHTAWIADQSFNNPFLMGMSGQCDFLFYRDHSTFKFYDMDLITPLCECIIPKKQIVVVHSLGCHFKYSSRYPIEMRYFAPDLNDVSAKDVFSLRDWDGLTIDRHHPKSSFANVARTILTNSYDNAIRYTDYFLDSVITTIEQTGRPAIVLYVADHGENLLDDEMHKILHGQESTSIWEYHVPMFVWASNSYKQRYPERWANMQANRTKQISTMNVYHSLLDMGGISIPQYDPRKSILSAQLQADTIALRLDGNLHAVPLMIP